MFEGLVADLLSKYLGKFVVGLNRENFRLALWGGDVVLKNLQLKVDALTTLQLPVNVKAGSLGELHLRIPWSSLAKGLLSDPIVIELRDIHLLVAPLDTPVDDAETEQRLQEKKQKKLAKAEEQKLKRRRATAAKETKLQESKQDKKNDGFVARLLQRAVDNIQILVENVHIRFEDNDSKLPFSFGFTLEKVSAQSTDENWKPSFLSGSLKMVHKLVDLHNLTVYCNPKDLSLKAKSQYLTEQMNSMIFKKGDKDKLRHFHYISKPLSGQLRLTISKDDEEANVPKVTADFIFDRMRLAVEKTQYRSLIGLLDRFTLQRKAAKHRHIRPHTLPSEDPAGWWLFAVRGVLQKVREKRYHYTAEYIEQRRRDRQDYMKYWTQKLKGHPPSPRLAKLEKAYSYEDILYFRSLAEVDIDEQTLLQTRDSLATDYSLRGWYHWLTGTPRPTSETEEDIPEQLSSMLQLSAEQKKNLYSSLGFTPQDRERLKSKPLPESYVKVKVGFHMGSGSVSIKSAPDKKIISGLFHDLDVSFQLRQGSSFTLTANLGDVVVYDRETPNTQFPRLLCPSQQQRESLRDIFSLVFDYKPPKRPLDFALQIKMGTLEAVIHTRIICGVVSYFLQDISLGLKNAQKAAKRKLNALRSATKEQLDMLFQSRAKFEIDVDVAAPLLILPERFDDPDTQTIIGDLGRIRFMTSPQEEQSPANRRRKLSEKDFYEKFAIQLSSLKVIMVPYSQNWRQVLQTQHEHVDSIHADKQKDTTSPVPLNKDLFIVQPFDIILSLMVCMISSDSRLPKVLIEGNLPSLNFYLSAKKIIAIVAAILKLVDDIDETLHTSPPGQKTKDPFIAVMEGGEIKKVVSKRYMEDKIVEVRLNIPKASLLLRGPFMENDNQDIVTINLEKVSGQFIYRKYGLSLYAGLANIAVVDHLQQWGKDFRLLITSQADAAEEQEHSSSESQDAKSNSPKDALRAYLFMKQKTSPEYEGVDQSLHIDVSALYFLWNRETVVTLLNIWDHFMVLFDIMSQDRTSRRQHFADTHPELISTGQVAPPEPPSHTKDVVIFQLTAEFKELGITLNRAGKRFVDTKIGASYVEFQKFSTTYLVKTILGNLTMEHLTPYELYSQILEIRGDKLVELSYENYDRLDPSWPGFDSWLRVRLHSIQIVLLRRFWGEFSNYFTEIKGIKSLVTATAKKMAEVASETADMINQRYVLRYEVEVANPTMFVPRSPTSQEAAILDLGHIFIANSYTHSKPSDAAPAKGNISREGTVDFVNLDEADGTVPETEQPPHSEPSVSSATVGAQPEEQQGSLVEQINISATAINMQSCRGRLQDLMSHLRGPNAKSYADPVDTEHILKNADLNLVITRASKDADPYTPQMKIDAYVREVATCMTQAQLYTLIAIYRENYKLGFVPDPEPSSEHSEQAPSAGSSPSPQTSFRISYQISVVLNRLSIELLRDSPISSTNRWTDDVDGGLAGGTSPKATHSTSFNKSVYNPLSPSYYSIMRIDMNKPRIFILMGLDESMTVDFSLESINIVDTRPTPNYYKYLLCSANKRNAKDQTDKGRPTRVAKEDSYKSSAEGVSPEDEEDIASDKEKEKEKEKEKQASDSEEGASVNVRSEDDDVTSIEQSQLLVYYRRDAKGAQALSITGHSPRLILLPDAVYSINQTLMPCVWALININTGLELMMATGEEATPPAPPPPTRLDMAVRLTSPLEIWIVENAFRKKTSCMVIQTDFTLRYVNDPLAAELGLTVVLESLAVSKADYIPEGKLKPSAIILPRVNAVYRYKRLGDTLQAQVHLDPVHITFSYKDFALLLRVLQELNPPPEKNQPSPSVDPASAESHKAAYETPPPAFVLDPPQKQRAKCKVGPLRLTFINDCGEVIPLADFRIYDVAFVVSSLSPKVSAAINFSVKGLYYNVALAKWEPIIEQWECSIRIKDTSKIRVMPEKRLDFNLTKSFFDTMKRNVELWQKDFYQIPMKDTAHASSVLLAKAKQKTFSPLYLCNDTGQKLLWWLPLRAAETPQDATELYPLEPSAVIPITSDLLRQQEQQQRQKGTTGEEGLVSATASVSMILSSSGNITTAKHGQGPPLLPSLYQMQRTIAFHLPSIPDAHPATNLPLHKVGTYLIPLMWPRDRPDQIYAIYEVTLADGSKVLNLRSNVLIRNETDHVLDIQVERHQRLQHDSLGPLAVKSSVSVPIYPAKTRAKFLRFRPHTDPEWNEQDQGPASCHILGEYHPTHYWTETPISCALPSTRCFALRSSPINADTALAAFYAVHVEARTEPGVQEGEGDHIVTVCPPLILENALVCDLAYSITNEKSGTRQGHLQRGESVAIYRFDTTEPLALSISVPGYKRNTPVYISGPNLKKKLALVPKNRTKFSHLDINIDNRITAKGTRKVSLYAQFWMINRTGLPLSYRQYPLPPKEKAQKSQKKWAKLIDRGGDPKDWGGGKFGEGELYKGLAAPVMFAYHQRDIVGNKVSIKIAGSHWSKPFSLENAGTVGLLEIKDKEHHTKGRTIGFQLSVQVDFAPPPFRRTKIITISPHVVLVNRMSSTIYYTQKGTNVKYTLEPNTRIPFHWPDGANRVKEGREMCIALPGYWHPSGEFDIEQLGQMVIKHRHHNGGIKLTGVEIRNEKGTNFVTFSDSFVPRYRVENCSPYEVTIYQKGVGIPQKLNMYESMAYCWDFPSKSHYLAIEVEEQFIRFVCLDKIKKYSDITVIKKEKLGFSPSNSIKLEEVSTPRHSGPIALVKHRTSKKFRRSEESNRQENGTEYLIIGAEITTDGPTRVLRILDRKTYPYFESLEASLKDTENEKSLKRRAANKAQSKITLKFKRGIGLSVVDGTPQELMYISMSDITLEYCNSSYYNVQYWDFKIKRFQIDNQLFFTPYPVVASPHMRLPADKSFLALSVIKSMEYREVDFYKYVALGVQELDVRIDETFLLKLLQFFNVGTDDISQAHFVDELLAKDDMICPLPSTTDTSRMLYFEFFHINPLQVNISFATVPGKEAVEDNPVRLAFGTLGLGIKLPNIEGAPIRLNSLILRHPFTTQEELIERISAHYVRQAIIQAYKVLGSFDFLGNPVSFLNNLGTGVKDFFYEPFNAFVQSPKELGDGLAKGTSSLVKNSVYGVFNSVSKVTESMAKGISKLSFDQTYQVERDNSMRERPHDAGQGLIHGAKGFTKGLIGGLSGVVVEPIRGAQSGGAQGLVKGMAKGVVGVAVKPSVGVIETVSKTAQGIRNQADSWERDRTARQRLPRYFGQDKMLVPYVKEQALGQAILYGLSDRRYMNEWYMCHEYIDPPYLLLCSNTSIILVNCHQKFSQPQKEWRLKLSDLNREGRIETAVEIVEEAQGEEEVAGLRFWTQNVSTSSNLGKAAMPFAPISDAETRARAYTKLTKLVTEELLGDMKWVELFRYE